MRYIIILINLMFYFNISCIKIDRVILSTDNNPNYIQFWPIVARTWQNYVGIKPTLALIGCNIEVDQSLGEIIKFDPIPGIPPAFHAQVIRLLLPILFENEVCIISDIDMIPLNKKYFTSDIQDLPIDGFVIFKNGYYEKNLYHFKYPMCYNASLGKNFKEIFNVNAKNEFEAIIKKWYSLNFGWGTDEYMLFKHLAIWPKFKSKCILLNHMDDKRVDKLNWNYEPNLVEKEYYTDAHCPRPYENYKEQIDELVKLLPYEK